ncbi:MAG: gliding motility protein GldL [Bacteroidales bacterium]|jgi:gliding motility-associated protein GldL|nr:gliding motility protein GldL [Bacteroidales bacterium]MEE0900199.1 gliding motility protein GldL [Bacteroidales bacterium]MEE0910145.1 gliding motility protein GldL [Bacteroidales bacterium]MEE0917397.1 gliding motility protein GldL [Bacteroidales bacterium]MEE0976883.1 gliding motility protein GldL [Bacteroidales bacterium]
MGWVDNFVRSKVYKEVSAKLYGIGASVVIVGALFKINHWPGGTIMLIIGMGIEAVIFFVSAFEPLHVTYDWSLVFPELAGMDEIHGGEEKEKKEKKSKKKDKEQEQIMAGGVVGGPVVGGVVGYSGTQDLDKMLADAKIGPELIESLGKGLKNLADTTSQLNDVAGAAVSSERFNQNLSNAASAAGELSEAYKKTADNLNKDLLVSGEYLSSVQEATSAVSTLANIYKETANTLSAGDASYLDELKKMASSLSSINALYEMQIQNSSSQLEASKVVQERIDNLVVNFADTAENVLKYKEQVNALSKKVGALNDIYGNMLAAMQTKA